MAFDRNPIYLQDVREYREFSKNINEKSELEKRSLWEKHLNEIHDPNVKRKIDAARDDFERMQNIKKD
jgi:hypothetical protein